MSRSEAPTQGGQSSVETVLTRRIWLRIRRAPGPCRSTAYGSRIASCACDISTSLKVALRWIAEAQELLQGRVPADLLLTREGALEVDAVIKAVLDGAHI